MKTKGAKGGTEASQGKGQTLEEKREATKALRKLRRLEKEFARMQEFKHHLKLMNRVRICGLVQVAHRNLGVLKNAINFPHCYLASPNGQKEADQAACDLNTVLDHLDRELSNDASEHGLV